MNSNKLLIDYNAFKKSKMQKRIDSTTEEEEINFLLKNLEKPKDKDYQAEKLGRRFNIQVHDLIKNKPMAEEYLKSQTLEANPNYSRLGTKRTHIFSELRGESVQTTDDIHKHLQTILENDMQNDYNENKNLEKKLKTYVKKKYPGLLKKGTVRHSLKEEDLNKIDKKDFQIANNERRAGTQKVQQLMKQSKVFENFYNTINQHNSSLEQEVKLRNRKSYFTFNNLETLGKQMKVFKELPKEKQVDILKKEFGGDKIKIPNTSKALRANVSNNVPNLYGNNTKIRNETKSKFFNKTKFVHRNFKEASVIWPIIKRENVSKAVNLEYIFENILG